MGPIALPKSHVLCPIQSSFSITARVQSDLCLLGQIGVYREASELADKLLGISISAKQINRICNTYGGLLSEAIKKDIDSLIPKLEDTTDDDPTYIMMDGSMLFTRDSGWKELKLARVFHGSKVIDIQKDRSEIVETVYCSHLGSIDDFFPKLERHLTSYKHLVVVGDGASWIWNWCEDNYPGCVQILDFFHAKEKLVLLGNAHFRDPDKRRNWLDAQVELLRDDGVYKVINNVRSLPCRTEASKEAKTKLLKYYEEHEDKMQYKTFRNKNYMIGSGPIEAAHRSVIQQRMKLSGQKWSIDGANAIASLRCYGHSDAWHMVEHLIRKCAA